MRYPRFVQISFLICASLTLSGCSNSRMSSSSTNSSTAAAPAVVAVGVQTNGVAPNRWQYVQFNEAMNASSINNQTFVVTDSAGKPATGTVNYYADFRVAGFEPNPALKDDANYSATITTGVTSAQGVHLAGPYTYAFITRASTDLSPLYVAHVSPAPDATCVSATTPITITFSEGADISTVNSTNIVVTGPGGAVIPDQLAYDVSTATATVILGAPLPSGTITVTVKNVADAAGVPMTSVYGWAFQTACSQPGTGNFTVLHSFSGPTGDGAYPEGPVVMDRLGNLYGTTENGGSLDRGTLFKIDPSGHLTVLHNFTLGSDGGSPFATNLLLDASGNLYGSAAGGSSNKGIVFKIDASGNETVLHAFTGPPADGWGPNALTSDLAGNLYGTTSNGSALGFGTVFKLDATGNETVLYSFKGGTDGANPLGPVVRDSAGNLYGTTSFGGAFNAGTVFKLDPSGNETVLYTFNGGTDGSASFYGGLVRDSLGNLYGTTLGGGDSYDGTIFKIDPSGNKTVLHSFTNNEGSSIVAGLIMDSAGNLYGTADAGGPGNNGTVFKLDPAGNLTVLHVFDFFNGAHPEAGLFLDPAGNLYGTTRDGGSGQVGTVFKVTP